MICPNCKKYNRDGEVECGNCGAPLRGAGTVIDIDGLFDNANKSSEELPIPEQSTEAVGTVNQEPETTGEDFVNESENTSETPVENEQTVTPPVAAVNVLPPPVEGSPTIVLPPPTIGDKQEKDEPEKKSSSFVRLIVVVVALLIGGMGVYTFMGGPGPDKTKGGISSSGENVKKNIGDISCESFFPGTEISIDGKKINPTKGDKNKTVYLASDIAYGSHKVDAVHKAISYKDFPQNVELNVKHVVVNFQNIDLSQSTKKGILEFGNAFWDCVASAKGISGLPYCSDDANQNIGQHYDNLSSALKKQNVSGLDIKSSKLTNIAYAGNDRVKAIYSFEGNIIQGKNKKNMPCVGSSTIFVKVTENGFEVSELRDNKIRKGTK